MFWIIIISFAVLMGIAIMIYMMPSESAAKARKKAKKDRDRAQVQMIPDAANPAESQKDWEAIAQRWEKNNISLQGELEKVKMREKNILKELEGQKTQNKDMVDKLVLEKGWREKEQVNLDKARHHEKDLKGQIVRTEKDLEREHSERLRIEREFQELKIKYDVVLEAKRVASTKAMSLETTVAKLSSEVKELQRNNETLKKKREDIQWVAKSEFDELQRQYNKLKEQVK